MQMLWAECPVCGDTIANQICYRCIEEQVIKWAEKKDATQIGGIRRAGEFFSSHDKEQGGCVLCGGSLSVCSKCYSLAVHGALRKDRILASEFLEFAEHKGFMLTSKKGVLNLQR